jgi:hypothetical protein
MGEAFATARAITDGDSESWTREWQRTGERVAALAEVSLSRGHRVSAREAFLRASTYYLASVLYLPDADRRKRPLFARHVECFDAACPLFDDEVFEPVEIPYEGTVLPGYLLRPDHSGKPRPTLIIQTGAHATAASSYAQSGGAGALSRGYNVLIFDGPGQLGACLRDSSLVYRPDWEVPIKAVVDYLVARPEVDADRIVLSAFRFGAYLGTHAVAFETRIAAFVVGALLSDSYRQFSKSLGIHEGLTSDVEGELTDHQAWTINEFMPRCGFHNGGRDVPQFLDYLKDFTNEGLEERITCPVLNLSATNEGLTMYEESKAFFNKLPNPNNRFVLTNAELGADHRCLLGNTSLLEQIQFDWLDEIFDS